jgi:uncharacterized protein (TIGR00369 family)
MREERIQQRLNRHSRYGELVGRRIRGVDAEGNAIEVTYEAREEFTNRRGTISGGMLAAMLDSVTGLAALVALPEELAAVHTALRVEYLRAARPGRITGRGQVVEQRDRLIRSQGELTDDDGTTIARAEATLRVFRDHRS